MDRDAAAAGRAVEAAMAARGWNVRDLAREAGVDPGTVGDFLAGQQWPRTSTRGKLEQALGWPFGSIAAIGNGGDPPEGQPASGAQRLDVVDAILADPYLSPEAKEHFLSQYTLLMRVRDDVVSREADRPEPVTDRRSRSLRSLPAVAHGGDPAHAEQVAAMAREIRARIDKERDDGG